MSRATSKGSEAKSKMKHSNLGGSVLWYNALPTRSRRRPFIYDWGIWNKSAVCLVSDRCQIIYHIAHWQIINIMPKFPSINNTYSSNTDNVLRDECLLSILSCLSVAWSISRLSGMWIKIIVILVYTATWRFLFPEDYLATCSCIMLCRIHNITKFINDIRI